MREYSGHDVIHFVFGRQSVINFGCLVKVVCRLLDVGWVLYFILGIWNWSSVSSLVLGYNLDALLILSSGIRNCPISILGVCARVTWRWSSRTVRWTLYYSPNGILNSYEYSDAIITRLFFPFRNFSNLGGVVRALLDAGRVVRLAPHCWFVVISNSVDIQIWWETLCTPFRLRVLVVMILVGFDAYTLTLVELCVLLYFNLTQAVIKL